MTRRDLALHLLREAGSRGITTAEFLQAGVGSRYGARLMELRQMGYVIESERIREGSWRYTLTHDPNVGVGSGTSPREGGSLPASSPAAHPGARLFDLEPASAALTDYDEAA